MGKIIAIGGGEVEEGGTLPIDREIVEASESDSPTALFIPTASEDSEKYVEKFESTYSDILGCETDVLELVDTQNQESAIRSKIEQADVIYVGGGNTRMMMELWRDLGVDQFLREAHRDGTVLSGLSAGAICWFEQGHSDSERYETDSEWDFIQVDGLDIVSDIIFCPHYHKEEREEDFASLMEDNPEKTGLAVDNEAAVKIEDGELELIISDESGRAYIVNSEGVEEKLETGRTYSADEL